VQSRIAGEVRLSKAQGRTADPWGPHRGTFVQDGSRRAAPSGRATDKGGDGSGSIPNVVVVGSDGKDSPTPRDHVRDEVPPAEVVAEDARSKQHGKSAQRRSAAVAAGGGKQRGSPKRAPAVSIKEERRKGKGQPGQLDPFDFQFQLVIAEDMHHLLDSSQDAVQRPWVPPVEEGPDEGLLQHHTQHHTAVSSSNPPAGSPTRAHVRPMQPEEPLTSKIELLRQQCEDGLGMDVFQAAYSALREHPEKGQGDFSAEVAEFLPDLRTLIRCEDIVYA